MAAMGEKLAALMQNCVFPVRFTIDNEKYGRYSESCKLSGRAAVLMKVVNVVGMDLPAG